jgi:hypothetical protein
MPMRKLRILLLAAVLAVIALVGAGAAFAAVSSGADASGGKLTSVQQQQQPAPDRQGDGKDCPFKNRGGSEADSSFDV